MHAQITGIGRLIADPETKFLTSGKSKTTMRVAVNHSGKKPEGQQYPNSDTYFVEVWGTRGEAAANHLSKGEFVYFSGRLEVTSKDGKHFLNVRNAEWSFTGSKSQGQQQEQGGGYDAEELPF